MLLYSLYEQDKIKKHQNFLAKDLKDQIIGVTVKQKKRMKIRQLNIDILSNQILLDLIY